MPTITFDTHSFIKKLKAVGFSEEQAEVFADEQRKLIEDQLVTKQYLDFKMKELEHSLVLKLGIMLSASIAILSVLIKVL